MSHARRCLIAAVLAGLSAGRVAAEPALAESKLNLRSGPGPAFGVIAVMPAGTKFDMQKCNGEWCRVKFGAQVGYASRARLKAGVDSYASAAAPHAAPAPLETKPTLTGPHVWQWRNDDWRNEHWRRLDWHNRMKR